MTNFELPPEPSPHDDTISEGVRYTLMQVVCVPAVYMVLGSELAVSFVAARAADQWFQQRLIGRTPETS